MGKRVGQRRTISITIITYGPQLMGSCCQSPECTKRPQPAPWEPTCISCPWIQGSVSAETWASSPCQSLSLVLPLVPSPGGTSAPPCRYLLSHLSSPCLQPHLLVLLTAFLGSGALPCLGLLFLYSLYIYISISPCWRGRKSLFCYYSKPTCSPEPLPSFTKAAPFPTATKMSHFYT